MTTEYTTPWFCDCQSPETVKTRYRVLAKKYHPDLGGDTRTMQEINAAYLEALKALDGYRTTDNAGHEHRYTFNRETESAVISKLHELQRLRLPENVTIALIGTWLWVTGETRPHKEAFKLLGCKYSGEKACWYWHSGSYRRKSRHGGNFYNMAWKYGYREFSNTDDHPEA